MKSEHNRTCKCHVLILKLTAKLDLKRSEEKYYFIKF